MFVFPIAWSGAYQVTYPVVLDCAQTGLSGVQLRSGLEPFSWGPSCYAGCYAVVVTAQEPPAGGRSCQKRVPFLGVLLGEWHHCLSAGHQIPVTPGQILVSGPSLRRIKMVPYREKGFRTGPEKVQCFPPSKIARCSHRQRGTRRGNHKARQGLGEATSSKARSTLSP